MLEKDVELFEDYLSNMLSETEKTAFEVRLNSETDLKKDFEAYKSTSAMLAQKFDDADRNAFKETLSRQSDAYFKPKEATKKSFSLYKYAAVAVLFISVLGFYLMNSGNPVYADYANIDSISLTQRSSANELVQKAEDAFNASAYEEASVHLKELIAQDTDNQELQLYLGIASIETNDYDAAFDNLQIVAGGNSVYKYEAQWYIALSYLKQKEYIEAKIALEKIPESAAEFGKAQELLGEL